MKLSLKQKILYYLEDQYPRIVHKGELGKKAIEWGFLNENMGRRCRELYNEGKIKRFLNHKNEVMYQFYKPNKDKTAEDLNKELQELINNTKITWDNKETLNELMEAKRTDNIIRKRSVVDRYIDRKKEI